MTELKRGAPDSSGPKPDRTLVWRNTWRRLTDPPSSVENRAERRQAQLLSSLLLPLVLLASVGAVSTVFQSSEGALLRFSLALWGTAIGLAMAYIVSRTRYYKRASVLAVGVFFALPFVSWGAAGDYTAERAFGAFMWMVVTILLGNIFLSLSDWVIVGIANMLALPLLLILFPTLGVQTIGTLLGFVVTVFALTFIATRHREQLESDRVAEANEFNRELQAIRSLLEVRAQTLGANQRAIQVLFSASGTVEPDELLGLVVNLLRDQFDLYHVQVYLVGDAPDSPGQPAAVLRQSTGYAGQQLLARKHHIPLDRPALVTKAIHDGGPVSVDDVARSPDFMPNPLLPDTRSELVVPLRVGERIAGVLDAQSRTVGFFDTNMVDLFQTMTSQIGLLFQNAEYFARLSEQTEALTLFTGQLSTAAEIARRISAILDADLLLRELVELMQSQFGLYHVHAYLLEACASSHEEGIEERQLVMRAGSGEVGKILCERGYTIPLNEEKNRAAQAAQTRKLIVVNDTQLEADYTPNPLLPQTRSELAVPLMVGDKILGVLDILDSQADRFSQASVDTFSTLSGLVATALQNTRLFAASRQRTERQVLINQIVQQIQSATTVESALQLAVRELGHAIGERTSVQLGHVAPPTENGLEEAGV
jgi:GAF domain-containing protein